MPRPDQIAFYAASETGAELLKARFCLAAWIRDTVTANVTVYDGGPTMNVAELQFAEGDGIQMEIIRYISGPSWLDRYPGLQAGSIAHIGFHLEADMDWPLLPGCPLVQEAYTVKHTNAQFNDPVSPMYGRRYHYRIFQFAPTTFVKYIRRLNNANGGTRHSQGGGQDL